MDGLVDFDEERLPRLLGIEGVYIYYASVGTGRILLHSRFDAPHSQIHPRLAYLLDQSAHIIDCVKPRDRILRKRRI
jgi:hypothetical protein